MTATSTNIAAMVLSSGDARCAVRASAARKPTKPRARRRANGVAAEAAHRRRPEAEIERINGIIAKIDTALALPDHLHPRSQAGRRSFSKARAGAERAAARRGRMAGSQRASLTRQRAELAGLVSAMRGQGLWPRPASWKGKKRKEIPFRLRAPRPAPGPISSGCGSIDVEAPRGERDRCRPRWPRVNPGDHRHALAARHRWRG